MKISHPESHNIAHYWEKEKYSQISDLKFHKTDVSEEDQHYQKPWIYQKLQLE